MESNIKVYLRGYYIRFGIRMSTHFFRKFWLGLPKHAWYQSELISRAELVVAFPREAGPVYTKSNITAAGDSASDGE